jgi:hypothetical protein
MRTLTVALIALTSIAALTHAQQTPQPRDPQALANALRQLQVAQELLRARRQERTSCTLPDGTSHPLNAVVTYEGQTYRCVEVFTPTPTALVPPGQNQTLAVRLAGWIKV